MFLFIFAETNNVRISLSHDFQIPMRSVLAKAELIHLTGDPWPYE